MANESNNKVGEFTVAPETLISKADQIKTSLTIVSAFMKMIEDAFKGIEDEEIWQGPLAEKYFENAKNFFKGGATLDDDSTNAGYNTYSTNVLAYADKVYAFLNEASGGYLETDTNVEKSVSGEDGGFIGPMPQDATGKITEQEPTTSAANVATTVAGAAGVAGAQKKEEELISSTEPTSAVNNGNINLTSTSSKAYGGNLSENQLATRDSVANYVTNDMGLNNAAAAAILANVDQECKFVTTNEYTEKNGNVSYGIAQWNGGRRANLENYCESNGYDYKTAEGQLKFLEHELKNEYPNVYEKLQSVENTPEGAAEAAEYYCKYYERPANKEARANERAGYAEEYFSELENQ